MKLFKKISAALCAGLVMSVAVFPLAAWTSADAEVAEPLAQPASISSVQPLWRGI